MSDTSHVTDYIIVAEEVAKRKEFEAAVKEKLREGWQPLGGPCVDGNESFGEIVQAMVKLEYR